MHVLIVDDESLIADVLRSYLESRGHHAVAVNDGAQATDAWASGDFDLLIADVRLPKVSGVDLLRKMRATGDWRPCLLISGHVDHSLLTTEPTLLPAALLAKPFSFDEFDRAVDGLIAG